MPALITSLVRTWSALVAGFIISLPGVPWALSLFNVDTERATQVVSGLASLAFAAVWYFVVRALEARWPKLGVLLGVPVPPVYPKPGELVSGPVRGER